MSAKEIACVVLASGLSERFGDDDKLNVNLCGKPLLGHVLETVETINFGQLFIVSTIQRTGQFTTILNEAPEQGQGHSLRLGLKAAKKKGWSSVIVVLGDMPLVTSLHLKNMADKKYKNQSVVSLSESNRLPPVRFNIHAIDLILKQKTEMGGKTIFDLLDLKTIPLAAECALDVDTPADLVRVESILKSRQP